MRQRSIQHVEVFVVQNSFLVQRVCGGIYVQEFDYTSEERSLSLEMRVTLISIVRMMFHYGKHLAGFRETPTDLTRITYLESEQSLDL